MLHNAVTKFQGSLFVCTIYMHNIHVKTCVSEIERERGRETERRNRKRNQKGKDKR